LNHRKREEEEWRVSIRNRLRIKGVYTRIAKSSIISGIEAG
jgi:hypothetical protein